MKLIGNIFKIIGVICLFFFVLPAVISFLIPVLGVVALIVVGAICIMISVKFIFGR